MRRTVRLRAVPSAPHPPYGLFVDPHRGSHTWWAVESRTLLTLVAALTSLIVVVNLAPR